MTSNFTLSFEDMTNVTFCFGEVYKGSHIFPTKHMSIYTYIQIQLPPYLGSVIFESMPAVTLLETWPSFCKYLENHILAQQTNPREKSEIFITYEPIFEIQALVGFVKSDNEGYFRLRVMVDTGKNPTKKKSFVGVEARVDVKDVRVFVASLRDFLSATEHDMHMKFNKDSL